MAEKKVVEYVNLTVLAQNGTIMAFKIKKNTPLKKLMSAYCDRAGVSAQVVRFRFEGQAVNGEESPSSLDMKEGDTIEVFLQQTGSN